MEKKVKKEVKFIDGFSESAWKSLVIKSLRMGWVEGLIEARKRLSKSMMDSLLVGSLFEDVFPAGWTELNECMDEIKNEDYKSLCQRETHHGRMLSDKFCDMEKEAVEKGSQVFYQMMNVVRASSKLQWLNPRVANCLYTWMRINPKTSVKRTVMSCEFKGMPTSMLDSHTFEGRRMGQRMTILSGHYENHRLIGQRVTKEGWSKIRREAVEEFLPLKDSGGKKVSAASDLTLF